MRATRAETSSFRTQDTAFLRDIFFVSQTCQRLHNTSLAHQEPVRSFSPALLSAANAHLARDQQVLVEYRRSNGAPSEVEIVDFPLLGHPGFEQSWIGGPFVACLKLRVPASPMKSRFYFRSSPVGYARVQRWIIAASPGVVEGLWSNPTVRAGLGDRKFVKRSLKSMTEKGWTIPQMYGARSPPFYRQLKRIRTGTSH